MSKFFEVDPKSIIGLNITQSITCCIENCGGTLVWFGARFLKFPLQELKDGKVEYGHACDISMICPECGFIHMFGCPVSEQHWEHFKREGNYVIERPDGSTMYAIGEESG